MTGDLPAHVLRLDHAPIGSALRWIAKRPMSAKPSGVVIRDGAEVGCVAFDAPQIDHTAVQPTARAILGLDRCELCQGTRECPDCHGPCEVCTLVPR